MQSDMTSVPPLSKATEPASNSGWPWWRTATVSLTSSFAVVMLWIAVTQAGGDWFSSRPSIVVRGDSFQLIRGNGQPNQSSFVIEPFVDGVAAISTSVTPFAAEKYQRIEWVMRSAQFPKEVMFAWRTRERGNQNFSQPLQRLTEGFVPLNLVANENWRGTITGVALVVRGPLVAPIEIASLRLSPASAAATARETLTQWTAGIPLKGYSIAFPFDAERANYMPPAKAVAIATALAILACLFIARTRKRPVDTRVLWAIFAGGWLLLDVRWQANMFRQVADTAERFAGKTSEEKLLAGEGSEVVNLVSEVKGLLPPGPARVLFLCDTDVIGLRGAYLLYPYNAYHNPRSPKATRGVAVPDYRTLRERRLCRSLFL